MAHPYLAALHGVDIILPDGRILFTDLHETIEPATVGLIGPNGSGKSTLGRVLAGLQAPSAGRVERLGRIGYVEQLAAPADARTLADVAGLAAPLAALQRLAAGDAHADDFDLIGERWDLESRWQAMLDEAGLSPGLAPAALSGGQRTLLALIGAFCSDADLLVLDERGNHLDRANRAFLLARMRAWRRDGRGLLSMRAACATTAAAGRSWRRSATPNWQQLAPGQTALACDALVARHGPRQPLSWRATGAARIAISGPNGCGKSTLLRTIAGGIAPRSGSVHALPGVLLDQHLALLDPDRSLLDALRAVATGHDEGRLRQMLALAGLGPERILRPAAGLSGGERMRGALLLAVLQAPTPKLLLDEPTNHLDLGSVEALETMLGSWPGALVVVSHDERFLDKLELTHRLTWTADGWTVDAASAPVCPT